MTDYNRGDVVLVHYRSSAEMQSGLRPAVVVSSETYHQGRSQLLIAAVTGAQKRLQIGDTVIQEWQEAGLIRQSLATGSLLTVPPDEINRKLGKLSSQDAQGLDSSLRLNLGI